MVRDCQETRLSVFQYDLEGRDGVGEEASEGESLGR